MHFIGAILRGHPYFPPFISPSINTLPSFLKKKYTNIIVVFLWVHSMYNIPKIPLPFSHYKSYKHAQVQVSFNMQYQCITCINTPHL